MKNLHIRITLPCLLCVATFFLSSHAVISREKSAEIETLTFTNTQTWLPRYLQWAETAIDLPEIALPPAPKNFSDATKQDLAVMHAYQDARTEKNIEEIKQEMNVYDALFGEKTLAQLVDERSHPLTFELMKEVIELESPQIMKQKKIYN